MAQVERLDFTGLSYYDSKLKAWVGTQIEEGQPNLAQYFNAPPKYNSESKKIEFYHDSTKVAELDATPFIKDGMVNEVKIAAGTGDNNGKQVLLVTFNTDSGKDNIELPLEGIFNPTNYMTKAEVEAELAKKADTSKVTELETEVGKKLDTSTYNTDKATFETKENAAATYQPKGEYALKNEIPKDYLTEEDLTGYVKAEDLTTISTTKIDSLFSE